MRDTDFHAKYSSADYDPQLADRIKSMLRDGDGNALPQQLGTSAQIQLISSEIMQGGLGRVGRYWDETLEREVAVKFINLNLESTHEQRFRREIMITSSLDHPGVVPIYNIGESDGNPYYTMRYVSGATFAEAIRLFHQSKNNKLDRGNPGFRALLESFKSACSTIGYAHVEKQVWHRDVKPQNIMIENGLTVVVDWGLAKRGADSEQRPIDTPLPPGKEDLSCLTRADQFLGSPAYMAPEQARGQADQVDNLTDIYGLGATLFELLTGVAPHQRDGATTETQTANPTTAVEPKQTPASSDIRQWLSEIADGPSPSARSVNRSVPSELDSICSRAMALEKSDRYRQPQQILDDIECWLVQADVAAHQYTRFETMGRWLRKHSGIIAVVCLASLLITAIAITSVISVSTAKKRTELALSQMRAERTARMEVQLNAYVSASPIQAEVFLGELESYPEEQLDELVKSLADRKDSSATDDRLGLIFLDRHPQRLVSLLKSPTYRDLEELSLLYSAIRSPANFNIESVLNGLWELTVHRETVLSAGAVLSKLVPRDPQWESFSPRMATELMWSQPGQVAKWSALLLPVRDWLEPSLMLRYQSDANSRARERNIAGQLLFEFSKDEFQSLVRLLGHSENGMFARLVERFRESPANAIASVRARLFPADRHTEFKGSEWLFTCVANSKGVVNNSFMVCDSIPLSDFRRVEKELGENGFRPLQVQKYTTADQRAVATTWIRDDRPFLVSKEIEGDEVARLIAKERLQGWVPNYLSADLVDNRIMYTVVFNQDYSNQKTYRALVNNSLENHRLKSIELGQLKFQQMSYIEIEDAAADLLIAGLYCQDPWRQDNASKAVLSESRDDNTLRRLADYAPMDMRRGPRGITSIWLEKRSIDGIIVAETTPEEQASRWQALAQEGFVPVRISTPNSHSTGSFSIWHRPKRTETEMANFGMALCHLGDDELILEGLKRSEDQTLRTLLIHRLFEEGISPVRLAEWLKSTKDPGVRSAIIQSLGQYPPKQLEASEMVEISNTLESIFEGDPDSGVHSAAAWTLAQWGRGQRLEASPTDSDNSQNWFVNEFGQTMAVVRGPVSFNMGTNILPPTHAASENRHSRTINRSFAIGTHEVTWEQFARFSEIMPAGFTRFYSKDEAGRLNEQAPQYQVSWYRAAEYCNWLSEQAGLPQDQWCYLPNEKGEYGPGLTIPDDFLARTGYRLPTEAEWEFAARAGTETSRFFGRDTRMISHYVWHKKNSDISTHTVGSLKPNELGLFDVYGNVWEWCHGSRDEPWPDYFEEVDDQQGSMPINNLHPRSLRGGAMVSTSGALRSSIRSFNRPSNEQFTIGFRVARTINQKESGSE